MNQLMRNLVGIFLLSAASLPVVYSQSSSIINSLSPTGRAGNVLQHTQRDGDQLIEEFSFLIKDFKLDHQTESHNLNISISYRYMANLANSEYPDFRLVAKDASRSIYPLEPCHSGAPNCQAESEADLG